MGRLSRQRGYAVWNKIQVTTAYPVTKEKMNPVAQVPAATADGKRGDCGDAAPFRADDDSLAVGTTVVIARPDHDLYGARGMVRRQCGDGGIEVILETQDGLHRTPQSFPRSALRCVSTPASTPR